MKNNKGFVITEVLILSSVIIGILIFMFAQFKNINRSYQYSFKYDTVEGLYLANNIINYINESSYETLVQRLREEQDKYLDITYCDASYFNTASYCERLFTRSKVEKILFVKEDLKNLKNNMTGLSDDFKEYINSIKISNAFNDYRIIIKYKDGTFATMRFNKGAYLSIPGEVMQDGRKYYDALWVKNNPIYYNPITGDKCDNYHDDNSNVGFNGISTNGDVNNNTSNNTGCLKWYAYSENTDGTVNVILDHNTSVGVKWYTEDDNSAGAVTALSQMYIDTDDWNGVSTRTDKYEAKWNNGTEDKTSLINYSGHKARLISAQEVANITGASKSVEDGGIGWSENTAFYNRDYFSFGSLSLIDYSSQSDEQKLRQQSFSWLFDNTFDCAKYGCLKNSSPGIVGYWTSTPSYASSKNVWFIFHNGRLTYSVTSNVEIGLRPVITVSGEIIVK